MISHTTTTPARIRTCHLRQAPRAMAMGYRDLRDIVGSAGQGCVAYIVQLRIRYHSPLTGGSAGLAPRLTVSCGSGGAGEDRRPPAEHHLITCLTCRGQRLRDRGAARRERAYARRSATTPSGG